MINSASNSIDTQLELSQKLRDRSVFDQFSAKPQKITCDKPRGRLVCETPAQQLVSAAGDTFGDIKNLTGALKNGKSNDTELGRMNDLGMKIGGGLIAAALMGTKSTTNKKFMEAAGFATFFATMSLWPKVMIDLPTKLRHGFNPHQKYIDSNGNKKAFFLDNQYLPWDIWPKEEINRIGDKMNVPKDIEDREEYTKEKMRTIALQDNTLWMLSAGFATPLVTSLVCNRIEEGTRIPIANANLIKLSNEADGIQTPMQKIKSSAGNAVKSIAGLFGEKGAKAAAGKDIFAAQDVEFAKITAALRNGEMPENIIEQLGSIIDLSRFADNEQVSRQMIRDNVDTAADLVKHLFPETANYEEFANALAGGDNNAAKEAAQLFDTAFLKAKQSGRPTDISSIIDITNALIDADPEKYADKAWAEKIVDGFEGLAPDIKKVAAEKSGYSKQTLEQGAGKLEQIYTKGIKPAQKQMHEYGRQIKQLDGISGEKYNRTAKAMLSLLGLNEKELTVLRNSNETYGNNIQQIITGKIKEIANDDVKYQKTMLKLTKEKESFENAKKPFSGVKTTIKEVFDKLTGKTSETIQNLANEIDTDGTLEGSALKGLFKRGITETEAKGVRTNITSVDSMITKLTNALELERKINDGSLLQDWAKYASQNGLQGDVAQMSADEIENFYNVCRKASWQSSYGDIMNKFYTSGNGSYFKALTDTLFNGQTGSNEIRNWQDAARCMALESECIPNTALEYKDYTNKLNSLKWNFAGSKQISIAEIPENTLEELKQRARFEVSLDKLKQQYAQLNEISTKDIPENIIEKLKQQAKVNAASADNYYEAAVSSHKLNFANYGESVLNTLKKQANQVYTDKKWMKIFGGAAAVLIGATLVSQLFFGKVKDAHLYTKKSNNDSFEGGKK